MKCPKCDSSIPPANVSLRKLAATCPSCNHHFYFSNITRGTPESDSQNPGRAEINDQSSPRNLSGDSFSRPLKDAEFPDSDELSRDQDPRTARERDLPKIAFDFLLPIGLMVFGLIVFGAGYLFFPKEAVKKAIQEKKATEDSIAKYVKDVKENNQCVEKRNQIWAEAKKEQKGNSLEEYWKNDFEKILERRVIQETCPLGGGGYSIKINGGKDGGVGWMFIYCPKHSDGN